MLLCAKAKAFVVILTLVYLLVVPSLGAIAAPSSLALNQLITSGQTVTLQAPSGDYLYQWTAVTGGSTIGAGTAQKFSFSSPLVSQVEGSKTVTISLYIRTKEGGCVNQTSTDISVYSLPVCGISGPEQVGPYDTATYSYTGGTAGKLTFEWNVDGKKIDGAAGSSVDINWAQYDLINHTIGMTLTRDYSDVAPGSTSPFRSISCSHKTNVTYTTGLVVAKTASATTASVGEAVTYTYTVRNTGTIGINSLSLKDDKLGVIMLDTNTLMPGTSATGGSTYTIKESDLPGPLNNTVTVSGVEDRTKKPVSTSANATVALTYNAALSLSKEPSSTTAEVGEKVTYKFTVSNTGKVTIKGLKLIDDKLGTITIDNKDLAPGDVASASATHVILEGDLPGPLTNVATIQGTDSQNKPVTATATASIALTYTSGLAVTKTVSSDTAKVGDTVTYRFSVKNNGLVTVNGLALNDDHLGTITLDKNSLTPGEETTGFATYTIVETDLPGPLSNVATASGTDSQGKAVTAQAKASVELTYVAALQVTKTPSASTAAVGETVTYQFSVKNTGAVTIKALTLTDDKLGDITLNTALLAPGETATGSAMHTIIETDLPGPLSNVATASGTDSQGKAVTAQAKASVELTYTAAMEVAKLASATTSGVGDSVTYTYTVRNTGTVTIKGLKLVDDKLKDIKVDKDTLAPGDTATGSATHLVVEADLPGPLTNVVTATAKDSTGKAIMAEAKATVQLSYSASMEIIKTPSTTSAKVGETVTYAYTVRNTGAVTINDLAIVDDKLGEIKINKKKLTVGETATGSATYLVVEGDLPGPLTNIVTGTARDSQGQTITATATAFVELTYTATLIVTKEPSVKSAGIGDKVTYKLTVKNTGSVTINGLTLNDDKLGAVNLEKNTLAPGETAVASIEHVVVESDLPSPLTNVVTAAATDSQGQPVTATAKASVELVYTATLEMTKVVSPSSAKVGETVTYTYTIKNGGKVTVNALTLTDDKLGAISLDQKSVAPGDFVTGKATYTIAEEDVPGPVVNNALLEGKDPMGRSISARASASVTITRDAITPELTCVSENVDGTYTAFFGYSNPNSYPVKIDLGMDNWFSPPPDNRGQPSTFEPGQQTAVFAVVSKGNALVWHLDGKIAEANKNSRRCSQAECNLDGPSALCRNKVETYSYVGKEDVRFKQSYEWSMDGETLGSDKSIDISGSGYELGEHKLIVKVTRYYDDKIWSVKECSMDLKVIPEPSADIFMEES
ncbi:MAG TPA: hypothetical protein VMY43_04500 [Methanothrix sp.]|nr:hypothetical protein [Methanothrix sp.]